MKKNLKNQQGFTLIEILVVIGIIAILAVIVLIAINPAKQFAQSRNTQRTSNVNALSNAIGQRLADNKGVFEGSFSVGGTTYNCPNLTTSGAGALSTSTAYTIKSGPSGTEINLNCLVPTYMASLPFDPSAAGARWVSDSDYDTKYTVSVDGAARITVCAPQAASETSVPNPASICITR